MSLFLGNDKVVVSHIDADGLETGDQILRKAEKEALVDAVNYQLGTYNNRSVTQMINDMMKHRYMYVDIPVDIYNQPAWVRPAGWPDLDSLNLQMTGDDDFIYMTYDLSLGPACIAQYITTKSGQATIDVGYIDNGVYIVDETESVNSGTSYTKWFNETSGYKVVRITGKLTTCRCIAATDSNTSTTISVRRQAIVERIAYVPNMSTFANGTNAANIWGTHFLQREKIANGTGTAVTSLMNAWYYCGNLESLDLSNFNAPNNTSMYQTFAYCSKLRSIDVSNLVTSKTTTLNAAFYQCKALQSLDTTTWDVSKVTNMASTFAYCNSLKQVVNLENWNTEKVTTFASMFAECYQLQPQVSNFNTSNATTLSSMFYLCYSLELLDLSNWNVNKVTNISSFVRDCWSLKSINFTGWQTGTLTTIGYCFTNCKSLKELDVSWLNVTNSCTNIYACFSGCLNIRELHLNEWDVSGISSTGSYITGSMFSECHSLETITGISNWQFNMANTLSSVFNNCYCLKNLDVSGWKVSTATSFEKMFYNCYSLTSLDLSNWAPSNCTNFLNMFAYCRSLTTIGDISDWDTSNVTNLGSMFAYCMSLKTIPNLNNWDTSKVTTIANMFQYCYSLKEIVIDGWQLSLCTNIGYFVSYCYNLERLILTNFSTLPALTTTTNFAYECWSLTDVQVSWQITKAYNFNNDYCLTHESILNIIDDLATVSTTQTLTLDTIAFNTLTAAEKAIATAKGWSVVGA